LDYDKHFIEIILAIFTELLNYFTNIYGMVVSLPEKMLISWESDFDFPQAVVELSLHTVHYCKSFACDLHLLKLLSF